MRMRMLEQAHRPPPVLSGHGVKPRFRIKSKRAFNKYAGYLQAISGKPSGISMILRGNAYPPSRSLGLPGPPEHRAAGAGPCSDASAQAAPIPVEFREAMSGKEQIADQQKVEGRGQRRPSKTTAPRITRRKACSPSTPSPSSPGP